MKILFPLILLLIISCKKETITTTTTLNVYSHLSGEVSKITYYMEDGITTMTTDFLYDSLHKSVMAIKTSDVSDTAYYNSEKRYSSNTQLISITQKVNTTEHPILEYAVDTADNMALEYSGIPYNTTGFVNWYWKSVGIDSSPIHFRSYSIIGGIGTDIFYTNKDSVWSYDYPTRSTIMKYSNHANSLRLLFAYLPSSEFGELFNYCPLKFFGIEFPDKYYISEFGELQNNIYTPIIKYQYTFNAQNQLIEIKELISGKRALIEYY